MLTKEETKLLNKYSIMPIMFKFSLLGLFLTFFVWLILALIDNLVFHSTEFYVVGFSAFFILFIILVVLMIYGGLTLKTIARHSALFDKIDSAILDNYIDYDDDTTLADIAKAKKRLRKRYTQKYGLSSRTNVLFMKEEINKKLFKIDSAYDAFDIKRPKVLRYILLLLLVPSLILIALYIPKYIRSYNIYNDRAASVNAILLKLEDAFADCFDVYHDDPYEYYSDYGYYFSAYLDRNYESYLNLNINTEGEIDSLAYSVDIDISKTKDENLKNAQDILDEYYQMFTAADVKLADDSLLTKPTLTDEFKESFVQGTYYDDITIQEDDYSLYYFTYPYEDFDKYTMPNIYISYYIY